VVAVVDTVIARDEVTGAPVRSARHAAIFDAVFDLLGDVGYDRMSMDAVAARARASKATIYRAWPNKPDLVMDALMYRFGGTPDAPNTGTLRGDLIALMTGACQLANGPEGSIITGLMSAATRNAELSRTLYRCTYELKHGVHSTIIGRAAARGELTPDTRPELMHELMHALVLTRKLWAGPLDDEFVVHVVDDVLLPVLQRGQAPDRRLEPRRSEPPGDAVTHLTG
jgi:AcrR family transcriptional regulator